MASEAITSSGAAVGVHATLNFAQATLRSLICTSKAIDAARLRHPWPTTENVSVSGSLRRHAGVEESARSDPRTCVDVMCANSGTEPAVANVSACSTAHIEFTCRGRDQPARMPSLVAGTTPTPARCYWALGQAGAPAGQCTCAQHTDHRVQVHDILNLSSTSPRSEDVRVRRLAGLKAEAMSRPLQACRAHSMANEGIVSCSPSAMQLS